MMEKERIEEAIEFAEMMSLDEGVMSTVAKGAGKVANWFGKANQNIKNSFTQAGAAATNASNIFKSEANKGADNDLSKLTKAENVLAYAIENAFVKAQSSKEENAQSKPDSNAESDQSSPEEAEN